MGGLLIRQPLTFIMISRVAVPVLVASVVLSQTTYDYVIGMFLPFEHSSQADYVRLCSWRRDGRPHSCCAFIGVARCFGRSGRGRRNVSLHLSAVEQILKHSFEAVLESELVIAPARNQTPLTFTQSQHY